MIKAGPLEAILVIFGRKALFLFVWKVLEKKKNDATFVRMRSGDHLGDSKMLKKGHLAPSNSTFLIFAIDRNGSHRMKEEGLIYKALPQIF